MRRQRGWIPIPGVSQGLVKLVVVLAIALAVGWILHQVKSYIKERDAAIFAAGEAKERGKWQERESKELAQANAEIVRLQGAYVALANQQATAIASAQQDHNDKVKEIRDAKDRFVADVRAGRVVLRDPGRVATACKGPGDGGAADPAAVAGRDAAAGADLSVEASGFLHGLAGEADEVVAQLALAQRELRAMYESCSARP